MTGAPMISAKQLSLCDASGRLIWHGVDFRVDEGEILGITGDSGIGKSLLILSLVGLVQRLGFFLRGEVRLFNKLLTRWDEPDERQLRRSAVHMVMQEPWDSFNPFLRIGEHYSLLERKSRLLVSPDQALIDVGLKPPARILRAFPRQLSGGEGQRAALVPIMLRPVKLLLADEPTASLDVANKDALTNLLRSFQRDRRLTAIIVSHDSSLLKKACDRVLRLTRDGLQPWIPKTRSNSGPQTPVHPGPETARLDKVSMSFPAHQTTQQRWHHVLSNVDLVLHSGVVNGLLGPSGAGKTTLARLICGMIKPISGSVHLALSSNESKAWPAQLVYQNSRASLNPKLSVYQNVADAVPRSTNGRAARTLIEDALSKAHIPDHLIKRFPVTLSGGEAARAAFARALASCAPLLVVDEPSSGLDEDTAQGIGCTIREIASRGDRSVLVLTHDLEFALEFCDVLHYLDEGRLRVISREQLSTRVELPR